MVKFIAEVSSNHAQDLNRSLAFVDAAAEAGFDAVKFQLFRVAQLFAPEILARSPQHRRRVAWGNCRWNIWLRRWRNAAARAAWNSPVRLSIWKR